MGVGPDGLVGFVVKVTPVLGVDTGGGLLRKVNDLMLCVGLSEEGVAFKSARRQRTVKRR